MRQHGPARHQVGGELIPKRALRDEVGTVRKEVFRKRLPERHQGLTLGEKPIALKCKLANAGL
jgi:hypothetical protein